MKSGAKDIIKRIIIVIPVIIAVMIAVNLVKSKKGPERLPAKEEAKSVRIIKAVAVDVIPRAVGYGYVEPGKAWQAVAEVSGKVIEISPLLKKGALCRKGEVLVRIDPAKYKLAIAQIEAGIDNIKAQLDELDSKAKNYKASLEIEKKSLALSKKELDRQKKLFGKGTVSSSKYDQQRLSYYAQSAQVQNIQNSINLIPATRKALKANLALNRVKLKDTKLDLEYTAIKAPFNCRIIDVGIEISQFVKSGQVLANADGIETAEIEAQISMGKMRNLIKSRNNDSSHTSLFKIDLKKLEEIFGLKAIVRVKSDDFEVEWNARFAGADATIDPQTRTLGVIVAVDNPYQKAKIGVRPPMVRNMFCEVELIGRPVPETIVIPRSALHDGYVYVVNSESRLERRKVETDFGQTNFHTIGNGLKTGESVVVSDLVPAIDGMLLEPVEDEVLGKRLVAEATGASKVK